MKFSLRSVLVLGSSLLSLNSFAATNAEVLENLYSKATEPATAEDFPERYFGSGEFVHPSSDLCIVVDGTDQPFDYDVARTIRYTPSEGPLVPEKKQEKLVFGNSSISYNLFAEPQVKGSDLVVTNPIYSTWVSGNNGVNHFVSAQLYARKSCHYVAFKVIVDHAAQGVKDDVFYGYCYPRDLPLF